MIRQFSGYVTGDFRRLAASTAFPNKKDDENKDNIIGMYIRHISEMEISDDLKAKALCYGMKAFYQTK